MDDLALGGEVPLLPVRAVTLSHVNIRVVLTRGTLELSMFCESFTIFAKFHLRVVAVAGHVEAHVGDGAPDLRSGAGRVLCCHLHTCHKS